MNFQELCEDVAEKVNGRLLTFSTMLLTGASKETDPFKRNVIKTVQKSHWDITLHSRHWRFLHKRGPIVTLRADENEYSLPHIESLDYKTLYLTQSTSTARWPIYPESYQIWAHREKYSITDSSIPVSLIRSPDPDVWIFWPAPSTSYILNGDYRVKTSKLVELTDEPVWDEEFHSLISSLAIRRLEGRVRTQDEIVTEVNTKTITDDFAAQWDVFCARYLPEMRGAPTLL